MSDVSDLMLKRFAVLYGEPKTNDLDAFVGEYERALAGMSREVLQGAADRVIKAQEFRSWPTPGECVKACHAEAEHLAIQRRQTGADLDKQEPKWPSPTEGSKKRCRELVEQLKAYVASGPEDGKPAAPVRTDRDAWNERRVVGVTRHGNPIRKSDEGLTDLSKRMTGDRG
jgi:hypothetical protein